MSKKQELSRFRNLTKGRLMAHKETLNKLMLNLPNGCKSLNGNEMFIISRLKECYRDILGTWDRASEELLNQCEG